MDVPKLWSLRKLRIQPHFWCFWFITRSSPLPQMLSSFWFPTDSPFFLCLLWTVQQTLNIFFSMLVSIVILFDIIFYLNMCNIKFVVCFLQSASFRWSRNLLYTATQSGNLGFRYVHFCYSRMKGVSFLLIRFYYISLSKIFLSSCKYSLLCPFFPLYLISYVFYFLFSDVYFVFCSRMKLR